MSSLIYLDNHATTPCDPQVIQAMLPYFSDSYGNPSSSMHRAGQIASQAIEDARKQVAGLINARPYEIIFTAGATESNNIVLLGIARGTQKSRRRIITTAIEHKSVLSPCKKLQEEGFEVIVLNVNRQGYIDLDVVADVVTDDTLIVSIQAANNEVGTIQQIADISRIAHERGAFVHCDAVQAVGRVPVDVVEYDVDLLSISGHKLYGPKGVGALYIRGGPRTLPIKPLWFGGGQEREFRPGTLNVPGIVGFGEACRLCEQSLIEESKRIAQLRDQLEEQLLNSINHITRNGTLDNRLPGNSSLTFHGLDAEALIANTPNLALSTGSACTSGAPEPSHVLLAMGLSRKEAYSTIRVGLGRFTTRDDINQAAIAIHEAVERLTKFQLEMNPMQTQ